VTNKDVKQDALDNLADALTEDILNTPDDELLREVEEDYGDPRALANKFDQILDRAEKQVFGTARPVASSQVRSSVLDLPYRLLEWCSTLFGSGRGMVWAGAAAVLIVLILAPAVFRSTSEFDERSRQLAALEKEQLAKSEQLAAKMKELLARSEQLEAREKELLAISDVPPKGVQLSRNLTALQAAPAATSESSILCKNLTEPDILPKSTAGIEPPDVATKPTVSTAFEHLICADADLAFWQNLVSEIYQHRWRQLDTDGQQILRQGQLDWLRKVRVDCNVPATGTWNAAQIARAKSCVLQSTNGRVAVLSNSHPAASATTGTAAVHVVAAGETLSKISHRYGKSVSEIAKANKIQPEAKLKVGERLVIPGAPVNSGTATVMPRLTPPR
jgi:nucleoid-associated protein YgaU